MKSSLQVFVVVKGASTAFDGPRAANNATGRGSYTEVIGTGLSVKRMKSEMMIGDYSFRIL